jgi:hypothetical protein
LIEAKTAIDEIFKVVYVTACLNEILWLIVYAEMNRSEALVDGFAHNLYSQTG